MGPPPISLRIRSVKASIEARELLRRLDDAELLQRRVRWQATKALACITSMNSTAGPKLRTLFQSDRDRWQADIEMIKQVLQRIAQRGV
jgi:hypothetical protein